MASDIPFLRAQIAATEKLLVETPESYIVERRGLERQLIHLRDDLAEAEALAADQAPRVPGYRVISEPGAAVHVEVKPLTDDEKRRVSTGRALIHIPRDGGRASGDLDVFQAVALSEMTPEEGAQIVRERLARRRRSLGRRIAYSLSGMVLVMLKLTFLVWIIKWSCS